MDKTFRIDIDRRRFLQAITIFCLTSSSLQAARSPTATDTSLKDPLWGLSDAEQRRLKRLFDLGLLEITPVARAQAGSESKHLGWPVATRLPTGHVILLHRRAAGHTDKPQASTDGHYILRSDTNGSFEQSQPSRLGPLPGMHCIGHVSREDGSTRVVAITSGQLRQVYLSDDLGVHWTLSEQALDGMLQGAVHCGPRMINHPTFGLLTCFGQETSGRRGFLLRSTDAGETWEQRTWLNTANARSVEPAMATWGPGHLVMISREWNAEFATTPNGYYAHTQHVYKYTPGQSFQSVSFTTQRTNIIGNPAAGLSCHDTAEVIFNPVSKRLEMLQSHRWGGGPGRTGQQLAENAENEISSLNLWSINPDDLLAGSADWRFDGTIIERIGYSRSGNRDGLHPGGSVINLIDGTQDIYVYAGWRRTPSSLYLIKRTLNTDKWRAASM
ncbi:MAG: hypothetical protein RLN76_13110 [Phycisphaeraceae bacterium]